MKITPVDKTFTLRDNKHAEAKYKAEFYKPGEAKPFEVVTGNQSFYAGNAPLESRTPYARLDIDFDTTTDAPPQDIQKFLEDLKKGLQTDPASLNKKADDFGCGSLQLFPNKGGVVEGRFGCGQNFNKGTGELKVTGTMTQLR